MRTFRLASLLLVIGFVGLPAVGAAQSTPLRILLTNDDGFDSAGLKVMHAALVAAGHQVTVVAPATNQSSTSMSMTSGTINIENKGNAVWAVHGTPADAAMIGLTHILKDSPQDLVVSGTNAGQNLGSNTNSSGTVSAALAAGRYGVPAVATSAGLGAGSANAYAVAAALTNQMIAALVATRPSSGKLLPGHIAINVNVPASALVGLVWAPLSNHSAYARLYSEGSTPGEVRSRLMPTAAPAGEADTDLAMFGKGYVTLTLLDGDLSVGASAGTAVTTRLSTLALPRPAGQ